MKKHFLIFTTLLCSSLWLITACKKDEQPTKFEDVVEGATVSESSDIRINRVEVPSSESSSTESAVFRYKYNPQGKLNFIQIDDWNIIDVENSQGSVRFKPSFQSNGWRKSDIIFSNNAITTVNVENEDPRNPLFRPVVAGSILFKRASGQNLSTVEPRIVPALPGAETFVPASVRVLEYNSDGTPSLLAASGVGNLFYLQEITYQQAPGVPNKLKRMLNEDILRLNKMGTLRVDDHINPFGTSIPGLGGEVGNWILTFGLHRLHVLSETNPNLVASIKTSKIETTGGVQTVVESNTKTFLYLHDVDNRNITINGLKVFYDVVKQR